jgi:hypothetical protein
MGEQKSLVKITTKYNCMVTGTKLMEPCKECSNPKGCLSSAMQYKENEEMDKMDEKAIVKISSDGTVTACAKGLGADECGYKAGAKVCGACGAMASIQKEAMNEDVMDADDDEEMKSVSKMQSPMTGEDEEDDAPKGGLVMKPRKRSRRMAMESMGVKTDDIEDINDVFLCASERKVYPMSSSVCEGCPGGCQPEEGMPGLLDIEGMALEMVGGKVLASAYVEEGDIFFVDVLGKDGQAVEFIADGSTGQIRNFHLLATSDVDKIMNVKSADQDVQFIDIKSAESLAIKALVQEFETDGTVLNADSEIFEGFDSYVFEIDGKDGYSYDVYIGLDGHYLGADVYDATEAEDIEAEAAELALKRAYSEDDRSSLAEEGMALPDGSYPIKDEADLRNAIQAFGRAKDKEKAKAHIMKRARELDREDLIPETWNSKADAASSGGIANEDDLRSAIQSFDSVSDEEKDKVKANIIRRAMALGLEEMIPTGWVPKEIQDEAAGEKSDLPVDNEFLKNLMEFEMLTVEEDLRNKF